MIRHFIFMVLSLIGILVNPMVAVHVYAPLGIVDEQTIANNQGVITGLLVFYLFYTFFYWGAVTRTGGTPFWLGSIFAAIVGGAEGSCIFLVVYAGILLIFVIFLQILLFVWHFFCLVGCFLRFLFARGQNGKDGQDGRGGRNGWNGRDGRDGAIGPHGERGERGYDGRDGWSSNKRQNEGQPWSAGKLYLQGDDDGVEVGCQATPWSMSSGTYAQLCSDVRAKELSGPFFELWSSQNGQTWSLVASASRSQILVDGCVVSGKMPLHTGSVISMCNSENSATDYGHLQVTIR